MEASLRGAFYTRFDSREALLGTVREHIFESMAAEHTARMAKLADTARLEDAVSRAMEAIEANCRQWGTILLRIDDDLETQQQAADLSERMRDDWAQVILRHRVDIRHADVDAAVRFVLTVGYATLSMAVRSSRKPGEPVLYDRTTLRMDLTAMLSSHLTRGPAS